MKDNIINNSTDRRVFTLIIYDIISTARRNKLVKFLQGYGFRVQKSAFEAMLSEKKYNKLLSKISKYATEEDSIRVYRIRGKKQVSSFGIDVNIDDEEVIII